MDWKTLAERYEPMVLLISRCILREENLSRDAAQESLIKLSKADEEVTNWDAWVTMVASNTARDFLRRRKRTAGIEPLKEDEVDRATKAPEEVVIASETTERVRWALESLPAADRDVLLLRYREGLAGAQIAQVLGISLAAAWQRVSRALDTLRSKLGESHDQLP